MKIDDQVSPIAKDSSRWLSGKPLWNHQQRAVDDTLEMLLDETRVQVIMACGSGKTRVAGVVAQLSGANLVVFFAPSLALIRQTLGEWRECGLLEGRHLLCICSDTTITDIDALEVKPGEVGIHTTTEPMEVNAFLTQHTGPTTLFCTYHSARALAKGLPNNCVIDLAVFDEAHKTAGTVGGQFTVALDDEMLPIESRLFLTATPRHSNGRRRTLDGDLLPVYSMDNAEVYGPVAFNLSFKTAIDSGIICDYRLIVSTVTDTEMSVSLKSETVIRSETSETRVGMIANQISMAKAMSVHGLRRAISFHSTVEDSKVFAQDEFSIMSNHGIRVFHVNGSMLMEHRESLIAQFDAFEGPAVLSNARCLSEGVDLPEVQLVGFMSPKESQIDIAQIIGRCLRRSPGKEFGYVLLPLYLASATSTLDLQTCVRRERYQTIWDVISTLQEQDLVLGATMSNMRTQMGFQRGYAPPKLDRVRVIAPPGMVDAIELAIAAVAIERLTSTWDENFGYCHRYLLDFGREPPQGFIADNGVNLGIWSNHQRQQYKQGILPLDRQERLEAIGFVWEANAHKWETAFDILCQCNQQTGDANVPVGTVFMEFDLGRWLALQRMVWRQGRLSGERIEKLLSVGVILDREQGFERFMRHLQAMKNELGNIKVARRSSWQAMPAWFHKVRTLRKAGRLDISRIECLNNLEFPWDLYDPLRECLAQLSEFKALHGHANPGIEHAQGQWRSIFLWIGAKLREHARGELDAETSTALESFGIDWNPDETHWQSMLAAVADFKSTSGMLPKVTTVVGGRKIGQWLYLEREKAVAGKLEPHRWAALEAIGADEYVTLDARWHTMFQRLCDHRVEHGSVDVTRETDTGTPRLIPWIYTQRKTKADGTIDPQRKELLDSIDFIWDARDTRKLQQSKLKADRDAAKAQESEKRALERMTAKQDAWRGKMQADADLAQADRNAPPGRKAISRLGAERRKVLQADPTGWQAQWFAQCGIQFSTRKVETGPRTDLTAKVERMIALLEQHGSYAIALEVEPTFSRIGSVLRLAFKANAISSEQVHALDSAGFVWTPLDEQWEAMFALASNVYERTGGLLKPDLPQAVYMWLGRQRKEQSELAIDRVNRLNAIGMTWQRRTDFFDANLSRLTELHDKNPNGWLVGISGRDPSASQIVAHMRKLRRAGKLSAAQVSALDAIKFVWEDRSAS